MSALAESKRAQARALRAQADALDAEASALGDGSAPADDLVTFPFGLEAKTAKALIRSGAVSAARAGRKLYARRSAVLAAVDAIARQQQGERDAKAAIAPGDSYAAVVHLERGRRRAS